jgi:hypothetical protein
LRLKLTPKVLQYRNRNPRSSLSVAGQAGPIQGCTEEATASPYGCMARPDPLSLPDRRRELPAFPPPAAARHRPDHLRPSHSLVERRHL